MKFKQILLTFSLSLVLFAAITSRVAARDTDIYFLDASAGGVVRPNLMLALDTSGSMNIKGSGTGTTKSRIDIMKEALLQVLTELGSVNTGLMRFSNNAGGPVVYPAQRLDAPVTNTGNLVVAVQDGPDDAQQRVSNGVVTTTNTRVYLNSDSSGNETIVGLRFQNVFIPQGVTITSAKIVFRADNDHNGNVDLNITADKVPNAPAYSATVSDISGRTQTTASVPWPNASVGTWTTNNFFETPNLASVVQEVVGQAAWCRGNAMAFSFKRAPLGGTGRREARAYETYNNNSFVSPVATLVLTYDPATIPAASGCHETVVRVENSSDDAEERINTGAMSVTGSSATTIQLGRTRPNNASRAQYVGVRFRGVGIPQGAIIQSATLEFEASAGDSSTSALTIKGEAADDAVVYSSTASNISTRSTTTASQAWTPATTSTGQRLTSPDITAVVQEIVNRAGWASGNAMAFRVEGTGRRRVKSYDADPGAATLLKVKYAASTPFVKTVRDLLKEIVISMRADANTPIVDVLYEAALYYRGEDIDYGKTRDGQTGTDAMFTRVSHPDSYTGGTLSTPAGCTAADPDSVNCVTEAITGSPVYTSPIEFTCQSSHIVLLTDGAATANNSTGKVQTMAGISSCAGTGDNECGVELTKFLFEQDQSSLSLTQNVKTHTIGFNITNTFLSGLASNGGGLFKTATDAATLTSAFSDIFNEVLKDPTSFVSPSLSVNAFNRLFNRDEVFFTLFAPQLQVSWPGNLKKYTLCADTTGGSCAFGEILDANNALAIDPATSKFRSTAKSFWSSTADGPAVQVGGAGAEIGAYTARRVYTYTGTSDAPALPVDLSATAHVVVDSNTAITDAMLGAASSTENDSIINWMRGQDTEDEDNDSVTAENRWAFADALHSRPVTVTYGGTLAAPVIKLFVGTNDGGVRMVDVETGAEDWIVYLPEFLSMQKTLRTNPSAVHTVGVDGSATIRVVDNNQDGIIDPALSDKVQVFVGMRRGGSDIYAFDVTPPFVLTAASTIGTVKPKFLWRIKAGSGNFTTLGETWSRPQLVSVWVKCPTGDTTCSDGVAATPDSKRREVLMFGGGYDTNFDDTIPTGADGFGNAIYMVDPDTGARLWWASGSSSGADLVLTNMKYSIPSDLALLDSNADGAVDRVYVGDTRGQLWRIDLDSQIDPDGSSVSLRNAGTSGYVFADVGCTGGNRSDNCSVTTNQNRRGFFFPPDIAQLQDDTFSSDPIFDYITIASGDREDPLDKKTPGVVPVNNRIYAFRDFNTDLGGPATAPTTLTESNLHNATADILADPTDTGFATALAELLARSGWYIDLQDSSATWVGEKGLARTTIFAGTLFVTTFTPPQSSATATVCGSPVEGTGRVYELNLLTATGVQANGDRSTIVGGGIPSELVVIIREGGSSGLVGTSGGGKGVSVDPALPQSRTYWRQK